MATPYSAGVTPSDPRLQRRPRSPVDRLFHDDVDTAAIRWAVNRLLAEVRGRPPAIEHDTRDAEARTLLAAYYAETWALARALTPPAQHHPARPDPQEIA